MEDKESQQNQGCSRTNHEEAGEIISRRGELLPQVHSKLCNHRIAANRPYQERDAQQSRVVTGSRASI